LCGLQQWELFRSLLFPSAISPILLSRDFIQRQQRLPFMLKPSFMFGHVFLELRERRVPEDRSRVCQSLLVRDDVRAIDDQ
jgi:hypothetical protein